MDKNAMLEAELEAMHKFADAENAERQAKTHEMHPDGTMTADYSNTQFNGDRPASEAPAISEKVATIFGCPCCGERRMDRLAWDKAGTVVTCVGCGADYDPNEV